MGRAVGAEPRHGHQHAGRGGPRPAHYDEWADYWPNSDIEPFASFINSVQKYVATSSALTAGWANASAITGDLVEFVRELKGQDGGDIGVHASIEVARTLLAAGVVDELQVVIAPAVADGGRRLLDGLPAVALQTIGAKTSSAGHLLVGYRVRQSDLMER